MSCGEMQGIRKTYKGISAMKEEHKEEQSRYTVGFFLLLVILVSSVLAVMLKALLVWFSQ
jgi:hypothetical protein